jgi:hypothetical protein
MSKSNRLNADKRSLVELRTQLVAILEKLRAAEGEIREELIGDAIELMGHPRLRPVMSMHKKVQSLLIAALERLSEGEAMEKLAANSVARNYPHLMAARNAEKRPAVKGSGEGMAVV